ncbi:uncharacterized protein LOC142348418 isoform X2 [Convolutriloba macropyga]|uniref:uncharacterized protein LOC142348418 isoform X2 n=1 Tax=Convolutriloba macropyga TaxID=536237 RepID=UPI003F525822
MASFSLFLLFSVVNYVHGYYKESYSFILPDKGSPLGRQCARYSNVYCFNGFNVPELQNGRFPMPGDAGMFASAVLPFYQRLNWFALNNPTGLVTCCEYQTNTYLEKGQRYGMSPVEYINAASNYSSDDMTLMEIWARYDYRLCVNVIQELTFARGYEERPALFGAMIADANFVIPKAPTSRGTEYAVTFAMNARQLTRILTFDWFKNYFICSEQPWICSTQNW